MTWTTLTRRQLYDLVWSEPITAAAERMGIAPAALAQACRRHRVPVPTRGFWARKATGRQGKQAIFVEVDDPIVNAVELSPEWPIAGRGTPAPAPERHERLTGDPPAHSFHKAGLPRLGLSAAEAATFIGISTTFFRKLVDDGTMPQPCVLGSRRLWSTIELSAAFSMLPREGEVRDETDPWVDVWADIAV